MLLLLLLGVLLLGVARDGLGVLLLIGMLWLITAGGAVVASTIVAGGFFALLLWAVLGCAFFYALGMNLNKQRHFRFGLLLAFLLVLTMVVYMNVYAMGAAAAVFATALTLVAYVGIGLCVAFFWKWPKHNRQEDEELYKQQAEWVKYSQMSALSPTPGEKRGGRNRDANSILAVFSPEETAALAALKGKNDKELGRMRMPEALQGRWNAPRREHHLVKRPLGQCKAMFSRWVLGWPGIVAYEALYDIVSALGRWVKSVIDWFYNRLGGALRRTQERLLGDRTDLLELPEEPAPKAAPAE